MQLFKKLPGLIKLGSFFLFILFSLNLSAQITVTVEVTESNGKPVPVAFVVSKNSSKGSATDFDGYATILTNFSDTLIVSHMGYNPQRIGISSWRDSVKAGKLDLKVILFPKVYQIAPVVVRSFDFTPNEKEYYRRIAEAPKPSAISSPISALYDAFSHEGKVKRKMQEIYQGILLEEMIAEKLNDELVRRITGDQRMTADSLRKVCFLPDHFILSANEYDLYKKISDCMNRATRFK